MIYYLFCISLVLLLFSSLLAIHFWQEARMWKSLYSNVMDDYTACNITSKYGKVTSITLVLLLSLTFQGCMEVQSTPYYISEELAPYQEQFIADAEANGIVISNKCNMFFDAIPTAGLALTPSYVVFDYEYCYKLS